MTWFQGLSSAVGSIILIIVGVGLSMMVAVVLIDALGGLIRRLRNGKSAEDLSGIDESSEVVRFNGDIPVTIHFHGGGRMSGVRITNLLHEVVLNPGRVHQTFGDYLIVVHDDDRCSLVRPESIQRIDLPRIERVERISSPHSS